MAWPGRLEESGKTNLFKEDGYISFLVFLINNPLIGVSHLWKPPYTEPFRVQWRVFTRPCGSNSARLS